MDEINFMRDTRGEEIGANQKMLTAQHDLCEELRCLVLSYWCRNNKHTLVVIFVKTQA